MGLRPNEISALIKEQIKHYDDIIEQKDVGTVVTVGDGVSVIHGLDNAMLGELLLFQLMYLSFSELLSVVPLL